LSTAESTLAQVGDALQFARENLVSAGNGAMDPNDRALIAQQLRGVRDQLVSLANRRDGAGGYVFGGQGTAIAPCDAVTGAPIDPVPPSGPPGAHPGEQQTGIEARYTTSQDGRAVFVDGGGRTVFEALDDVIALLESNGPDLTAGLATATDAL